MTNRWTRFYMNMNSNQKVDYFFLLAFDRTSNIKYILPYIKLQYCNVGQFFKEMMITEIKDE